MLIKDFISRVNKHIVLTQEYKERLLRELIPNGLTEILDAINFNEGEFTKVLSDTQQVNLPYDFGYPLKLTIAGEEYDRVDLKDLEDGQVYAIVLNRERLSSHTSPLMIKNIINANIITRRSRELNGYYFRFRDTDDNEMGLIYDNENVFYPDVVYDTERALKINIVADGDIVRVRDNDVLQIKTEYSILNIVLKDGVTEYFVAEDGSTYEESTLTTLITRPKPSHNNYAIKFYSSLTGELKLYYSMALPSYINENEDEGFIDLCKEALTKYCLKELYLSEKKTNTFLVYKNEYAEKLRILSTRKGKVKEFRVPRKVAPNVRPFRLPFQR